MKRPVKRLSPAKLRVLRWLAAGGFLTDRYGSPLPQPALGAPPLHQRTLDSLERAGLAAWETRTPLGLASHQVFRITDTGRTALAKATE